MRDPYIEMIEAKCDAENERRANEYWDIENEVKDEDPEPFDECCGPMPVV